jgi:Domain of Unknown Function (DUF928)
MLYRFRILRGCLKSDKSRDSYARSPQPPLIRGTSELKVTLIKGDLGGSSGFKCLVQTLQTLSNFSLLAPRIISMRYFTLLTPKVLTLLTIILATSGLLAASILPVQAAFRPPTNSKPIRTRTPTTGIRGGCTSTALPLLALAPQTKIGQTTQIRPTVHWYVPDPEPMSMMFVLEELDGEGNPTQIWQTRLQSQSGIMAFSLPQDAPALDPGRVYRWQAVLLCNPNSPSSAIIAASEIEVVALSELQSARVTNDREQRTSLYEEYGIWYDALTEADDVQMRSLLNDLIQVEANQDTAYSDQLRKIVETLE